MNDFVNVVLAFQGAFSSLECGLIRDLPLASSPDVGVYPPADVPLRKAESSVIPMDGGNEWIASRLEEFARRANQSFKVATTDKLHPVLRVRYRTGDYFDWHSDLGDGAESTRKLSLSLQLSESESFSGGEFHFVGTGAPLPAPKLGTLLVFPSHFAHRVTPVTQGERFALVAWVHGPPFT